VCSLLLFAHPPNQSPNIQPTKQELDTDGSGTLTREDFLEVVQPETDDSEDGSDLGDEGDEEDEMGRAEQ
jgi:hypothetical protein